MLTPGSPVCTTAGPQTPSHTCMQTVEPVVSPVGWCIAAWMMHRVGELMDSQISCPGLCGTEATIMGAISRVVPMMLKSTVTVTK